MCMKSTTKPIRLLKLSGIILAISATYVSAQPSTPMGTGSGQVTGMGPGRMMAKHMKMMDQDGDGKISLQEFMDFHDQRFQQMDVNGDGALDSEELSMGMRAMRRNMRGGRMSPQQHQGQLQPDVQKSTQEQQSSQ